MTIDSFGHHSPLALLRNMGIDPEMFSQRVSSNQGATTGSSHLDLFSVFSMAELAAMLEKGAIPMGTEMPAPAAGACQCPHHYADPNDMGFGGMEQMMPSPEMLMEQGRPAMFQELMRTNPFVRQQVEMMLGGRVVPGQPSDMALQLAPFAMPGGMPGMPGGMPMNAAYASLAMMQQEAAFMGFMAGSAFQGAMLSALMQAAMPQARAAKKKKKKKKMAVRRHGQANRANAKKRAKNARPSGGPGGGGGGGKAQFQSGKPGPYQGAFGIGKGNGDEITNVLNDPTLTVEDKVTLMIMLIMKKMDKDIEKQAQEINKLQQQQNKGGGAGGGGQGGLDGAPSIDVETMKLKRLIDKRSQMFDMLRQIIDKYNQTAKGIIDTISR